MGNPENMHALLRQGEFGNLLAELQKIKDLNKAIMPLLPEPFRDCQVSRIQQGTVTLDVPNGSMATMLRYELPNILSALRKDKAWMGLASIKTRVAPPVADCASQSPSDQTPEPREKISDNTREHLQDMANSFEDDDLRAALLALASHL